MRQSICRSSRWLAKWARCRVARWRPTTRSPVVAPIARSCTSPPASVSHGRRVSDRSTPGRDRAFMRRALALAEQGWGQTAPNPMVGAVVVAGDEIVGEGFHARYGDAHAEVAALRSAGDKARG